MKRFTLFQLPGLILLLMWLLVISGCGRQETSSDQEEANGTGSLAFQLQFGSNSGSDARALDARGAASTAICLDYQIYQVAVKVLRSADGSQVAADSKVCSLGGMTFNNIPAGVPLSVVCEGFVGADPMPYWRGQSESFVVQAGQNYILDPIRMAYQGSDHTAPVISSTIPGGTAPGPSNIVRNTSIIIDFNERLARGTVSMAGAFHLRRLQDNVEVNGTVVYEEPTPTTFRIRFTPQTDLNGGTGYYYTLSNLITDTAANPLSGELRWQFTTGDNHAPVVTITSPANHSIIAIDTPVQFVGSAVDQDEGNLSGTSLVWTLDEGPQLGTGANILINSLNAGVHRITLTAMDLVGAAGTAVITLHVGAPIPDTGQIASYTDIPGEDSDYSINPQSYTKLDANGNDLPDSATAWAMVRDNVTGLIWENKTDDPDTNITIHDKDTTYTWQDAQNIFIAQLNIQNFGGHNDWRLPSVRELSFIVNAGQYNPSINTSYFGNTVSSYYWSSTTYAAILGNVWRVEFSFGNVSPFGASSPCYVRAVRGGPLSMGTLVDNGDTVSDTATGLMWQKAEAGAMTWEQALNYCETLQLAGHTDWRLPNRNELQSIVDYTRYELAIDRTIFSNAMSYFYWSSTTYAYNPDYLWYVYFSYGLLYYNHPKSITFYVRCVRGGE
ncbi:MAG: DUF1566 domain-containing protein [Desulfobacteraceae bacterium]|nr:DUF1566 domain-containing protein [Desulfobacteraceae bacterium]